MPTSQRAISILACARNILRYLDFKTCIVLVYSLTCTRCVYPNQGVHREPIVDRLYRSPLRFLQPGRAGPGLCASDKAEEDYQHLQDTWKAKQYEKALDLAETFLKDHPGNRRVASALYMGANGGTQTQNFKRAVALYRMILEKYPESRAISNVREELVHCLSGMRALKECIEQSRENLKADPENPQAHHWRFLIPQSQFRFWQFKESEKGFKYFLKRHPDSTFAGYARRYLAKIDPPWKMDENGIVEYSGKYDNDHRLKTELAALADHVKEGRKIIRERLGVGMGEETGLNFIFRDAGNDNRKGLMAETFTISRNYKPVTVILFYTEHVVANPESYRKTITHEMKHAAFRAIMGQAYHDLPEWIREGLAQWVADQLEGRIATTLNNKVFSGKDPLDVLDGVADPIHNLGDYLEDVLAFEWLENQKKGNVASFCQGIVKGKPWREVLAAASGLDAAEALRQMDRHCRNRLTNALGTGGRDATSLRDTFYAEGRRGGNSFKVWLKEKGVPGFSKWLDDNPGHVLQPFMWFFKGRGLILTGKPAEGRKWMARILETGSSRSTLCDDALFWEGYAFQLEGNRDGAARSFGILLRDYSWSRSSAKVRGKFKPAGPETEGK